MDYCSKDFRFLVTVERLTEADDGYGGVTASWATHTTLYCMIEDGGESETNVAGRIQLTSSVAFTTRYHSDVLETDRLLYDGVYYNIRGIENPNRRNKYLIITTEAGVRT